MLNNFNLLTAEVGTQPYWTDDAHKQEHAITVTSYQMRWRLKLHAPRLFSQPDVQEQIKENIKAPHHWPLCVEFTGDRWNPRTKGQ